MSKLKKCLQRSVFSEETKDKLSKVYDSHIKEGLSDNEATMKVVHGYHNELIERHNNLKQEISDKLKVKIPKETVKKEAPAKKIVTLEPESELNEKPKLTDSEAENELAIANAAKSPSAQFEPNIKAIEGKTKDTGGISKEELTKLNKEADGLIEAATDVVNVPIKDIQTDEARFQNRDELDKDIVKSIAENFNENEFDPIVLWKDGDKTFVLAGHHRLEGAKQAGKKSVKARYFAGNQSQAIEFAKVKSNANRTLENPVERAKIYRDKLASGESKKTVEEEAKKNEGKNASFYLNIAALNPNGMAIQTFNALKHSEDQASKKEVDKIMDWIGDVKRSYDLTDAQEQELFEFLFKNDASKRITTKSEFRQKVSSIVSTIDYDPSKPLNIARYKYKTQGETQYESEVTELKFKIQGYQNQITDLKDRFSNPKNEAYVSTNAKDHDEAKKIADDKIDEINQKIKATQQALQDLYSKKGDYLDAGSNQGALFQKESQSGNERIAKIIDVIQKNFPKVKVVYDSELPAAGMLKGDTISINPFYAGEDTPIHEAAHVLLDAMGDDKILQQATEQLKNTPLWKEVEKNYPELSGKALANEVMAEAIGREGKGIFDDVSEQNKFIQYLNHIFDWFKQKLGLDKNIAKSLAKQIISGIGTKEISTDSLSKFKQSVDMLYKIKDTQGASKKRTLAEQRRGFLEANPSIKNIEDNIKSIFDQLQDLGDLKLEGDCF